MHFGVHLTKFDEGFTKGEQNVNEVFDASASIQTEVNFSSPGDRRSTAELRGLFILLAYLVPELFIKPAQNAFWCPFDEVR